MSIFGAILSNLGFGGNQKKVLPLESAKQASLKQPNEISKSSSLSSQGNAAMEFHHDKVETSSAGVPSTKISDVDVVSKLEGLAKASNEKLNWKTSIVDLMKLLDLDSSLSARKELATELGCSLAMMSDSASMNIWLHKTVLKKLAENGGNIPADMLN
jgi:hypothetical protein